MLDLQYNLDKPEIKMYREINLAFAIYVNRYFILHTILIFIYLKIQKLIIIDTF